MSRPGQCSGCGAPATRELLTIPGREPFPQRVLACEHGSRIYGLHFTRRLPFTAAVDVIPTATVNAQPTAGPAKAGRSVPVSAG